MGNQPGKEQNFKGKYKKNLQWNKSSAGPPSPPSRPELVTNPNIASDAVTIRWARPVSDGGAPIQGYIVEHRRIGSQHWLRAVNMLIPNNELTISGLDPGWKYQFRVIAQNVVGISEPSESSEPLTVMLQRNSTSTLPIFSTELENTAVVEHSSVEFKVTYYAIPVPEIVWYRDGFELLNGKHTKIFNDPDSGYSTLVIENVLPSDEGEIKCSATNFMGNVQTKAHLSVENPPKVILPKNYEDGLIVEAEEILRLKITIEGRPAPTVIWTHNGSVIHSVGRYEIFTTDKSSSLRIINVQRSDRGEYLVKALNKIGEDSKAFLVTVTSKPDPPGKAIITKCIGGSATVTFSEPGDDGGCKIGNYIIEYNRVGWDVWLKATTCRGLTTTLHDLFEGSEYKFRVKAENPYGVSDPGEESYLLFIPDVKRGILQPLRNNVSSPTLNGTRNSSTRSSLLSIPEEKSRYRSATPDSITKVDSETSTRPESSPKQKPKHTISVQFAANIYDDLPSRSNPAPTQPSPKSSPNKSLRFAAPPKAVFDITGEPTAVMSTIQRPISPMMTNLRTMKNLENLSQSQNDDASDKQKRVEKLNFPQENNMNAHSSSEFMFLLHPDKEKEKLEVKNENQDTFDFEFDAVCAPPPPLSLSSPELGAEMPMQPPMRPAVSSTELLYERAMAKFYQAVANEEAQDRDKPVSETKKLPRMGNDDLERRKSLPDGNKDQIITRMRFNSLQEDKRLAIKRRLSTETPENLLEQMRRSKSGEGQSLAFDINEPKKEKASFVEFIKPEKTPEISISPPSNENKDLPSPDRSPNKQVKIAENVQIVNEEEEAYSSDYTDSTVSSTDSIVAKMASLKERLARIESDDDDESKTYHPRSMDLKNLSSPYKLPEHGQAVNVLSKPHPLPDPNFVPKPILKRPTSPTSTSSNVSSPPVSIPSSPTPPSPTTKVRSFSPPPPKTFGSPLMKPPSPKQIEMSSGARQTIEEREKTSKKQKKGIKKFFEKITTSPLSSKEKLNLFDKKNKQEPFKENKEIKLNPVPVKVEQPIKPVVSVAPVSITTSPASPRPQISASNERGRKLLQQRQNSEEENKTVIDHYTTILRDRDSVRTAKDKIPIYLNPEAIKKVHEKAKLEGDDIDLDEEENKPNVSQGKRELDLSALTFVRRQRSRESSLNRGPGASRDPSLTRGMTRETSVTRGPQSRDQSLSRNPMKEQFSATIVLKSNTLPKTERDASLPRRRSSGNRDILPTKQRDMSLPTKYLPQNDLTRALEFNNSDSPLSMPFSRRIIRMSQDNEMDDPYNDHNEYTEQPLLYSRSETGSQISTRSKTPEELEVEERVKSNMSYAMDVCLLGFAFYLYIFKDAVFCIPILILLIYRQLGEAVKSNPLVKPKET